MKVAFRSLLAFFVALMIVISCSSDRKKITDPEPSGPQIGRDGGTVTGPAGFTVTFPEGAVESTVTVRIQETTLPYYLPRSVTAVSKILQIDLEGDSLRVPATLQFPLTGVPQGTPIGQVAIYRWNGVQWSVVGGTKNVDSTGVQASVSGFSVFVLGTGPSLHKPVQFNPHMNTYNPVIRVYEYTLAHPELDAPPGQSVAVFKAPFDYPPARMILPQGCYSFCYYWTKGEVDENQRLIYYYAIYGHLPDHPAVCLDENSSDIVPPILNLNDIPDGVGVCPGGPIPVGGGTIAVPPGQATVQNFVGTYNLLDPNRTWDQYHGTVVFNLDGSFTSSEFVAGYGTITGQGVWSWTQAPRTISLTWQPGGAFQGVITGNTNDFTISGVWSNQAPGLLRFYR
jgi:hypothetical protein